MALRQIIPNVQGKEGGFDQKQQPILKARILHLAPIKG